MTNTHETNSKREAGERDARQFPTVRLAGLALRSGSDEYARGVMTIALDRVDHEGTV